MSVHFGQIVRVYDRKRYTIWDLDGAGPAIPCYVKLDGKFEKPKPGDIVRFTPSRERDCAISARLADPGDLSEAQIKNSDYFLAWQ